MNLEEALDNLIEFWESQERDADWRWYFNHQDELLTILRCADEEWQRRQGPVHPLWAYHIDGRYVWPENLWKEFIVKPKDEKIDPPTPNLSTTKS